MTEATRGHAGLILLLGSLTAIAPMSIDMYLPAFPALQATFATDAAAVQRTLSVFFIGLAIGQLFYGPLSDRYGRRLPLLVGLALYTVASAGCALAGSIAQLMFWRGLQALGGCAGVVMARAVVRDVFGPREAARVLSSLMLVMGVAPILAPMVGGWVLAHAGWRVLFGILVAFGAATWVARGARPARHGARGAGDDADGGQRGRGLRSRGQARPVPPLRAAPGRSPSACCLPTSPARRSCTCRCSACRPRVLRRCSASIRSG